MSGMAGSGYVGICHMPDWFRRVGLLTAARLVALGSSEDDGPGDVVTPAKGDCSSDGEGSQLWQYCSHEEKKIERGCC